MTRSFTRIVAIVACCCIASPAFGQIFDLADTIGGGNGTLPGTGSATSFPNNGGAVFLPQAGNTFVDGIFVPLPSGPTQINSSGATFDFSPFVATSQTNGGPGNGATPWINDPSNLNGNPDYTGDPFNHSIISMHAVVGVTFDLQAILATNPNITVFNTNAGGSCAPRCEFFVIIDGTLVAQGGPLSGNNFTPVSVPIPSTAGFLTLAMGDYNTASINCAHGYFGDPHLSSGAPPCSLIMAQPVPGSIQVENIGCTPFNPYVTAYTFNQGAFPNGWFFGIDIPWYDLIWQATTPVGQPTNGTFDVNGGSLWVLPAGVPPGLTIFAVTVDIDPMTGQPNPTPAVSFTTM